MPRVKAKPFRKYAKRTTRRKFARRRARIPFANNAPFERIRMARLRYYEEVTINPTSGTVAAVPYGANCMWDVLLSTGGHQPMGFDQLMALYDHYEVYGARITVRFIPNGDQYYCGVYLDDDTSAPGGITQIMEQRGTKMGVLTVTSSRPTIVTKNYSQIKTYGKPARGSDNQRGTAAANPTEQTVFQVWMAGVGGADPAACTVLVEIEYFAKFSELKTLPQG